MAVSVTQNKSNRCLHKSSNVNSFDISSLIHFWCHSSHLIPISLKSKTILLNTKVLFICLILLTFAFNCVECDSNSKIFINEFAVCLKDNKCDSNSAQSLADKHGFELVGQVLTATARHRT